MTENEKKVRHISSRTFETDLHCWLMEELNILKHTGECTSTILSSEEINNLLSNSTKLKYNVRS